MTGHWDAAAIAVIALVIIALLDRAYIRALRGHRRTDAALRAKDRAAYRRRFAALRQLRATPDRPVRTPLMEAYVDPTVDEPMPYLLDPGKPLWTSGEVTW